MKRDSKFQRARWFRQFWVGWVMVGFVGATALGYWVENGRGRRAWEQYVQEATAKGQHVEWEACLPSKVPDAENFARTPLFAELFAYAPGTQAPQAVPSRIESLLNCVNTHALELETGDWIVGQPVSLAYCLTNQLARHFENHQISLTMRKRYGLIPPAQPQRPLSGATIRRIEEAQIASLIQKYAQENTSEQAEIILESLEPLRPAWEELREAMARPRCRYPVHYEVQPSYNIRWPHLAVIKQLAQCLRLSAICRLELGQTEAALRDLELGFYLVNTLKNDPGRSSYYYRYTTDDLLTQAIWEGTIKHRWASAQLERLQKLHPPGHEVAEIRRVLVFERANALIQMSEVWANATFEWHEINEINAFLEHSLVFSYLRCGPQGWMDREKIQLCQRFDDFVSRIFALPAERICTNEIARFDAFWNPRPNLFSQHCFYASMYGPPLKHDAERAARAQVTADLAYLGCALERHWLDTGAYPASLGELAPRYAEKIPTDILTGESYRYRLEDKDHYLLYAIGIDGKDDGGTAKKQSIWRRNSVVGDWLWLGGRIAGK
jgi:hypothetical protein